MSLPTQLRPEDILKLFYYAPVITTTLLLLAGEAAAAVLVEADTRVDTYLLLHEKLGGTPYEVPDCGHSEFGPHITQQFDHEIGRDVFAFHLHRDFDDDRCLNSDRQRTEIKVYSRSADHLKGFHGESQQYLWLFKLDDGVQPSGRWTHIFQIKPAGDVGGSPLFTLSLGGEDEGTLKIQHDGTGEGTEKLHSVPLSTATGEWLKARVVAHYAEQGSIEVDIRKLDGEAVLRWSAKELNMWRPGTTYNRPKWGIYRGLSDMAALRDETVLMADICISRADEPCPKKQASFNIVPARLGFLEQIAINPFPSQVARRAPQASMSRTNAGESNEAPSAPRRTHRHDPQENDDHSLRQSASEPRFRDTRYFDALAQPRTQVH